MPPPHPGVGPVDTRIGRSRSWARDFAAACELRRLLPRPRVSDCRSETATGPTHSAPRLTWGPARENSRRLVKSRNRRGTFALLPTRRSARTRPRLQPTLSVPCFVHPPYAPAPPNSLL